MLLTALHLSVAAVHLHWAKLKRCSGCCQQNTALKLLPIDMWHITALMYKSLHLTSQLEPSSRHMRTSALIRSCPHLQCHALVVWLPQLIDFGRVLSSTRRRAQISAWLKGTLMCGYHFAGTLGFQQPRKAIY